MPTDQDYFKAHSSKLVLEESDQPGIGLRRGQIGSLYALGAHFASRSDAAVVSLPTGYGKTAVLLGACFLLRASRILVIEPTNTLRKQTFGQMSQLHPLKRLQALPLDLPLPTVIKLDARISTSAEWTLLEDANIVVATPHCASPATVGVPSPSPDLFDLVLMDEGHHAAAATWEALIKAFPRARHVLVSATPFRRDGKELPGKTVFSYPLKRAVAEKAFSRVVFQNVVSSNPADQVATDIALAKAAEMVFKRDRNAGYTHRMLIRASSRIAANGLEAVYSNSTQLRVKAAHSGLSKRRTDEIENELRSGVLDGVICVDMFGEGYDLPLLKIGVLHAPHQSLVPSLQFIGRFARTSGLKTGDATFLAVQDEVAAEGRRLYEDGVDWDELLSSIADGAQLLELSRQETLQSFDEVMTASADYDAVSPGGVSIFKHVTVYQCDVTPDLKQRCPSIGRLNVVRQWFSTNYLSTLILAADIRRPGWSNQDAVIDSRHDMFLLVYRAGTRRLFIGATDRKPGYYDSLVSFYLAGKARKLSYEEIKKVLAGIKDLVHHNVGVKNISPGSPESYKIIAGSGADRSLSPGDGRIYREGHFMGRGNNRGEMESIGASSTSRTWGSGYLHLPEFLRYVADVDVRLGSNAPLAKSGLDLLPGNKRLSEIPSDTMTADWPKNIRRDLPSARWHDKQAFRYCDSVDLEFSNFSVSTDKKSLNFGIHDEDDSSSFVFRVDKTPSILQLKGKPVDIETGAEEWTPLAEWLSEYPPMFFTSKCETYQGHDYLGKIVPAGGKLRTEDVILWDWAGCLINKEFDLANPRKNTVHKFLRDKLVGDGANQIVLYDHRSGELADYVAISVGTSKQVTLHLYHCKGAGGLVSGARTNDVTELLLQTVKCLVDLSKESILKHVKRRTMPQRKHRSIFERGDLRSFETVLSGAEPIDLKYEIYAVQPGISFGAIQPSLTEPMAGAVAYINQLGPNCRLRWLINSASPP